MKFYEIANIDYNHDKKGIPRFENTNLAEQIVFSKIKTKKKFEKKKKPKEITTEGAYCPKEKPGMSWSHIKDTRKEDDTDREDVA